MARGGGTINIAGGGPPPPPGGGAGGVNVVVNVDNANNAVVANEIRQLNQMIAQLMAQLSQQQQQQLAQALIDRGAQQQGSGQVIVNNNIDIRELVHDIKAEASATVDAQLITRIEKLVGDIVQNQHAAPINVTGGAVTIDQSGMNEIKNSVGDITAQGGAATANANNDFRGAFKDLVGDINVNLKDLVKTEISKLFGDVTARGGDANSELKTSISKIVDGINNTNSNVNDAKIRNDLQNNNDLRNNVKQNLDALVNVANDIKNIAEAFAEANNKFSANITTEIHNQIENIIKILNQQINLINIFIGIIIRRFGSYRRGRGKKVKSVTVSLPLGATTFIGDHSKIKVEIKVDDQGRPIGGQDLRVSKVFPFKVQTTVPHKYVLRPEIINAAGKLLNYELQAVVLMEDRRTPIRGPILIKDMLKCYVQISFISRETIFMFKPGDQLTVSLVAFDADKYNRGDTLPTGKVWHDAPDVARANYVVSVNITAKQQETWTQIKEQVQKDMSEEIKSVVLEEGAVRTEITDLNKVLEKVNPIYKKITEVKLDQIFAAGKVSGEMVGELNKLSGQVHQIFAGFDFAKVVREQEKIHSKLKADLQKQLSKVKKNKERQAEAYIKDLIAKRENYYDRLQGWLSVLSKKVSERSIIKAIGSVNDALRTRIIKERIKQTRAKLTDLLSVINDSRDELVRAISNLQKLEIEENTSIPSGYVFEKRK